MTRTPKLSVTRVNHGSGVERYRLSFGIGSPVEFLMERYHPSYKKEWVADFAESISISLLRWKRENAQTP